MCNTGTSLVPTIDGKSNHFYHVGIHDALFVMQDAETKTLWNHITGEAVYGPLLGRTIGPLSNLLQMTVKQAIQADEATRVAISDRTYFAGGRQHGTPARGRASGPGRGAGADGTGTRDPNNTGATMSDRFARTLGTEDLRRPRMDIGLGVWSGTTSRYYPIDRIRKRGEVFLDRLAGRTLLVYVDPESNTPAALFVEAKTATREGSEIRLDDGSRVRAGVLLDAGGRRRNVERPQQMFTRWYGFSLTFPGCEVFAD